MDKSLVLNTLPGQNGTKAHALAALQLVKVERWPVFIDSQAYKQVSEVAYAVAIVDTDYWLDGFNTISEARVFCEKHGLVRTN